jgi:hypothetical protein
MPKETHLLALGCMEVGRNASGRRSAGARLTGERQGIHPELSLERHAKGGGYSGFPSRRYLPKRYMTQRCALACVST